MMSDDDRRESDERLIAELCADLSGTPDAGEPLDPNLVAGFLEGRLADDERERVIALLDRSPAARAQLTEAGSILGAAEPVVPQQVPRWGWFAAAAAVVLAVGAAVALMDRGTDNESGTLTAALAALRTSDPGLFSDFRLLDDAELGKQPPVERGGLAIHTPQGALLEPRPTIRWTQVAGVRGYRVRIRDDAGVVRLDQTSMELRLRFPRSAPRLETGKPYVVVVEAQTAAGAVRGSRAFRVLDDAAAKKYRMGAIVIENDTPPALRSVVGAHWALRFDLVEEADQLLGADAPPNEPARWRATRAYLDGLLGRKP